MMEYLEAHVIVLVSGQEGSLRNVRLFEFVVNDNYLPKILNTYRTINKN